MPDRIKKTAQCTYHFSSFDKIQSNNENYWTHA